MPDFAREIAVGGIVAGIDEAGRGPLAGPVVAAAVVLDRERLPSDLAAALDDSKKLTAAVRAELLDAMMPYARIGVGAASAAEIDRINILRATYAAMRRAVIALRFTPDLALVDGNGVPELPCLAETIVEGDGKSVSIAAASIVAKVTRDRLMTTLSGRYCGFGWEHNAGYGTPEHLAALERLGPTPHHRRSWAPVLKILSRD